MFLVLITASNVLQSPNAAFAKMGFTSLQPISVFSAMWEDAKSASMEGILVLNALNQSSLLPRTNASIASAICKGAPSVAVPQHAFLVVQARVSFWMQTQIYVFNTKASKFRGASMGMLNMMEEIGLEPSASNANLVTIWMQTHKRANMDAVFCVMNVLVLILVSAEHATLPFSNWNS